MATDEEQVDEVPIDEVPIEEIDITDESWDALEQDDIERVDERYNVAMFAAGKIEEGIADIPDSDAAADEALGLKQ